MTGKEASRVVVAGLLELVPERTCAACDDAVALPGRTEVLPLLDKAGVVALFFCAGCGLAESQPTAEA
jgi:peptidoglycan/xylan/chitin deacetylase (PgdA/CDA1 family)